MIEPDWEAFDWDEHEVRADLLTRTERAFAELGSIEWEDDFGGGVRKLELLDAAERPIFVTLIRDGDDLALDLAMLGVDLAQVSKLYLRRA